MMAASQCGLSIHQTENLADSGTARLHFHHLHSNTKTVPGRLAEDREPADHGSDSLHRPRSGHTNNADLRALASRTSVWNDAMIKVAIWNR